MAAVGSDYRMKASLTQGTISVNQPIHLGAELTEAWWPAPNAAVSVDITKPDGSVVNRNLFDDGLHGDGEAGDAIFGVDFTDTSQKRYYEFLFRGTGLTERGETIVREELLAKYVVGPRDEIPSPRHLISSFHVGATCPLGDLNAQSDSNVHVRADVTYMLKDYLHLLAMIGLNQFTAEHNSGIEHPRWINSSINIKALFPAPSGTGLRCYLQGGSGYYRSKAGSNDIGFNVGTGAQIPIGSLFRLEFGIDYHHVITNNATTNKKEEPADFLTLQLGVLFR